MLSDGRICYDISPEITERLAVFPGDMPFERKVSVDFTGGAHYLASSIHGTVHLGAHVDAPNHYDREGVGIDARDLDYYLGDCQVISVRLPRGARIRPADLGGARVEARRVIFKTGSFPDPNVWSGDFNSLSPELVRWLSDQGVILAGIDTPSIDPADDKLLETHAAIRERNMAVLEGVVLDQVRDGIYTLIALPLRIRGADASPVRAVLVSEAMGESGKAGAGGGR
jgi:arylformamidase